MQNDVLMNARAVRATFGGVTGMTLHRWVKAGILPQPTKINGRNYWREVDVARIQSQGTSRGHVAGSAA